jgi:hypothetical protein
MFCELLLVCTSARAWLLIMESKKPARASLVTGQAVIMTPDISEEAII